jgi:hypothetical protein
MTRDHNHPSAPALATSSARRRVSGITLLELLIVIAVMGFLVLTLLPHGVRARSTAPLSACGSNLKQLALGMIVWANDNEVTHLPVRLPIAKNGLLGHPQAGNLAVQFAHFSNEVITPKIFACPSDREARVAGDFTHSRATGFFHPAFRTNALSYALNTDPGVGAGGQSLPLEQAGEHILVTDRHVIPENRSPCSSGIAPVAGFSATKPVQPAFVATKRYGHGQIANVALADGSVQKAASAELSSCLAKCDDNGNIHFLYPREPPATNLGKTPK